MKAIFGLACVFVLWAAGSADGATTVAVVDVPKVHEGYARTIELEAQFDDARRGFNEEVENRRARIERDSRALQEFKPGTADFQERRKQIAQLDFDLRYYTESKQAQLEQSLSESLLLIHMDVQAIIKVVADERQIDVVVAGEAFPEGLPESAAALKNQILLQKVLYWNPRVDITSEVIVRLNSQYEQQRGSTKPQSARPVASDKRLALGDPSSTADATREQSAK